MKLVLIRRLEINDATGGPTDDLTLSLDGLEQLSKVEGICHHHKVQAVISSTMPRGIVGAEQLARKLKVPLHEIDGLQERDFGAWDEWEWPRIAEELDGMSVDERFTFVPPNGESWQHMEHRLQEALRTIHEMGYESVAVITHWGPIRALLPVLRDEPKDSTLDLIVANGECFVEELTA